MKTLGKHRKPANLVLKQRDPVGFAFADDEVAAVPAHIHRKGTDQVPFGLRDRAATDELVHRRSQVARSHRTNLTTSKDDL